MNTISVKKGRDANIILAFSALFKVYTLAPGNMVSCIFLIFLFFTVLFHLLPIFLLVLRLRRAIQFNSTKLLQLYNSACIITILPCLILGQPYILQCVFYLPILVQTGLVSPKNLVNRRVVDIEGVPK